MLEEMLWRSQAAHVNPKLLETLYSWPHAQCVWSVCAAVCWLQQQV